MRSVDSVESLNSIALAGYVTTESASRKVITHPVRIHSTPDIGRCSCVYGKYLLLPVPRLPSFKARYHFLLAQAETGVPRISPVSNQGAPVEPVQLSTVQGTVTPRYNNKKEPTPHRMACPGTSTYFPLPFVSCRAMKPGTSQAVSTVKSNQSRKVTLFSPLEKCQRAL